jgi:hypothetical protein
MIKEIDSLPKKATQSIKESIQSKKYEQFLRGYLASRMGKVVIAIDLLLLICGTYLYASRIILHNSDNASILLQAYDLIHSSKILKGWNLPTDNFLTLDIPLYALGLLLGFNMHVLMKAVPVLLYTGVVFAGIYLASLGKTGKQKIIAVLTCMAIIVFPSYTMLQTVLQGPIHLGTILGTLLAFIAYYYYKERSYKIVSLLIVSILTCLLVFGDPMSEIILVFPIVLVEAIFLYKSRFTSRSQYIMIGTVLLSTLLTLYVQHIWKHYVSVQIFAVLDFESVATMASNVQDAAQVIFASFHADVFQKNAFSVRIIPELLNALVVILLIVGVCKWMRKIIALETPQDAITALLVCAIIGDTGVFIFTNVADGTISRYLLPVFVFGGIVAFSMLSYIKKPELYAAVIGLFLLNSALFFYTLYRMPPVVQPEKAVITLLQEKHLTKGLGQYWSGTSITGQSNYAITIRQVIVFHRRIHPTFLLSNNSWFSNDALKDTQFVIYRTTDNGFYNASVGSFGKPDHIYKVGNYVILAWNTPLFSHVQPGYHFFVTN